MTCSRDTLIQLRANLLAKGYTESQVDTTLKLILEKSKNETFRTSVESKTIAVISEEEKAFLRSTYTKLQDRIASITKADEPLNKSFKELVSSLLHADDRIKFFQILNKLKIADGDFSSLDTSYLSNLESIIAISRNKNRKTQVLRLEERLEKERERLLRRQEQEKESQSVKDKLREEIENVQQLLTFISSVLDGSVSSESTEVINKVVDLNKQIADVRLGIGLRLAELTALKEKLKKIKVTGTEKERNALKAKIQELDETIKILRKKTKDLDKQRANFIKEQIKKGLLTPKEELKEYESLSSLKIQVAKRVNTLKEKLANETLKTFQQSSRQIAKSLEEKLVRERTASISIQNAYKQRVRILNAYIEQRQDAFPDEPVIVDIGFLMHLVGNNAFERYLKENRLVENKDKSTTVDRSDFTEDEAKKLIEATSNYSYSALSQGFFSEDIATATDAQLAYLEAVAMGKQVVDITETNVNNIPVAPNNPNFLERSNPGVIPIQNKAKTAKELASWLEFTLRGLHSLKASKFNNGYISSVALDMVLHPRLYDMVSTIAFKDAIAPRSDKRLYSSSDRFAQLFAIKEMLRKSGIVDPDKLPEFDSDFYGKDPKNDTLVTLDIETEGTEDGTLTGIYSIQLTTYNMGERKTVVLVNRNIDGVNTLVDNKTAGLTGKIDPLTPEQIKTVLDQVETLQNSGYKLITYNGNSFDLSNLNLFGGDPKQLLRVTSRSIDLLENIRFDTGRQRVGGSKLKVVGENNLPTYERLGYEGRIRFTNGYVQEKLPDGSWNNIEINQTKMNEMVKQANETGDWTVFNAYAENDTELTLDLYFHLMSNDKTNLKLVYKGTPEFVILSKPRSNLFLSLSEVNPGSRTFKESMPSILAMNPEIDSIANQMGYVESTQINLDSVIDTIQGWLLEVWATDPNNKATLDILTEGLQEESSVKNKLHALAILKANKFDKAIKPLAKQYFKQYGYVDRLNFIEDPDTGRLIINPSIYTTNWETINVEEDSDQLFVPIEGLTEEIRADLYEKQVIIYFLENLENSQTFKKILQLLPERFGVRKMLQNEQFADYFMEVLPEVLSQYTKINRIADFGNGNVDWHTAYDVGNAIADVLNNKQEGVTLIDNFVLQGGNVDNISELNGTFAAWQGRQKNFIIPDKTRINFASPFGIAHESLVYDNFRLVTRINWILNQEWTNTELEEILDWAQKPQGLDPNEVISFFAKAANPTVFPEVRSRSAFDLVPDLDERKRIGMEFIYGMPRLLSIFNHDCAYRSIRFPNKFLGKEAPVYYTSEWMSAGAPTAAAISAGAIDQIAWMLTFDMDSPESEAELMRSVEAAVTLLRSNPDLIESTNKSDYSYHGLHIMLAALKFYTPSGWSDYLELLKDLQVAEIDESGELIVTEEVLKKQLDPRFKAIDLVIEELGKIKNGTAIENTKYALNASEIQLLEEIATFFDKDRAAGKEFLKGAVTPRFYQAGAKGIFNGLLNKIEDSNLPLNANHARVLTKVLLRENMNTHMTLIDQAIGLSKVDTKQVQQVFRKFAKTMSSANFQAELGLMQQQNWYGEMDWRKREEGIRNYFNRYISLLADKLVTTRLSKTEREKAIKAKEEELRNLYKDRIWKATHAFGNVDFSLMSMEEKIKHQEKIGIILSGGKKGYERHLVLWALNKRAATPTKLLDDQIELHRRITGTHIDSDDYEGWLNRVIFHTYGLEAASGRNHMYGGYGYGPESSKLGQVRVEEGDEKNLLGIWDIDDSNVTEEDYNRAFGTQLLLDLAPYYRPPVGYNSLDERESVYFETMERRSVLERQASREAELLSSLDENKTIAGFTVKDILEKQAKVSGRPIERMRYRRLASNLIDETNLINLDSSVDGIGATRPMLADLDFTQRGIYSLIGMQNQINIENSREGRLLKKIQEAKDRNEPLDINSIIPIESRGFEKPTTRDALPMIPLQTGNTLASMITGPTSEIEQIAIRKRNQLTVFAKLNGLDSLLEDKRWDLLYFISEGRRRALKPAMEILSGSTKNQQQSYFTAKTAFFDGLFKLIGLTARQYNPDKTYSAIEIQAETGEINFTREFVEDLKSKNPEGLSYLALLYHLSHVYRRLEGIKLGLVQDPGIRVAGPEGLIKSPTRSLPLSDFNFEVSNMYMNILTSDVMARVATDYLKASHPELYNTIAKDQNGFVIVEALPLTDVKMHQIITKVTREKAAELVQEWTKNNLILGTAYSDISLLPRETVSEQTGPLVIENKRIGTTHTFTSLNNPDTLWAFTEEMVVQLLNNLSNNPLFTAFELAFQTGKQIGSGNTVTDQLIQEEQRNLFNYMGQFIEDEHAAIVWLHMMDPSPSRGETLLTINNYKIKDKFGNPTQLLDAPNYIRKTFNLSVDEFFSAPISIESLIYTTDIMKSIKRGDRIGLTREADKLKDFLKINLVEAEIKPDVTTEKLVTVGSDILLRTVSVLYNLGTDATKITRQQIMNYVQPGLTTESQTKLFQRALEIVKIMQRIDNTNMEENQIYYYVASGLMDKLGEFNADLKQDQGFLSTVIDSVGVSLTQKERTKAIRSIQNAVDDYISEPGHIVNIMPGFNPRTDIAQFADPDRFIEAFGDTGRGIVDFLNGQVTAGNMSERTRDLKLILIGSLAMQNPNILKDLQLEAVELEGSSYAKAAKYNNKYTIGLNISAIKVTPENEILFKFAEELVHIARIKYLKDNSVEFETLKGIYRSENARGMIREMLMAMNMGKPYNALEQDVEYAMSHEEEFLSHFGAAILLQETIYSPAVLNELEAKYETVHKLSNWWKRAFHRIKLFAKHSLKMMSQLRTNPYYSSNFELAYKAIQGIIGNGLKDKVDVDNPNMEFNARKIITTTTKNLDPGSKQRVKDASQKLITIQGMLKDTTLTLTPEQITALETEQNLLKSQLANPEFNPQSVMGISESQVQRGLAALRRDTFGRIINRRQVDFSTRALIAEGLNNYFKKRGNRVDNKDTIGGLIRIWEGDRQFIDNYLLYALEGFNQNGLTYNSPEALAVMISDMLDDTTVNTQSSYRSNKNTGTFVYNKELLKSYFADFILHSTLVSSEFANPDDRQQIMVDLARKVLGLPLFSTDPKFLKAIDTLYKPFKVWQDRLRSEIFKAKIKENIDYLDPIGVKHKISRDISREQEDIGFRAIVNLMRTKYLKQLDENKLGSVINPYILFMGGLLPDPSINISQQAAFKDIFIKFTKAPDATATNAKEAMIKHLVQVALDKKLKEDQQTDPTRTIATVRSYVANNPGNLHAAISETIEDLIYRTRENDTSFTSELVTLSNSEIAMIFDVYVDTVNITDESEYTGNQLRVMRGLEAFGFYQGQSKYLPTNSAVATPMDSFAFEYLGRLGASAYLFDTRTPMLTYQDLFLSDISFDPDDLATARLLFEEDIPSIQHSLLKGIGYDSVQRIIVQDMLGIPGAFFTIGQIIDMVQGLNNQEIKGSEDKRIDNLDGHKDDARRHTIERSLERLRLANNEARETLGFRKTGHGLVDTVVRLGRPATLWAYGSNIPLATALVEGGMGAIGSTLRGQNPVSFLWDAVVQNTVMATRALGDVVTVEDGRLKFFDVSPNKISGIAENSLWLMEEMFSPMLSGRLIGNTFTNDVIEQLSAWERLELIWGRMQSSTMKAIRVSSETQARRRIVDMVRNKTLFKLRDSVNKILKGIDNPSNETLKLVIRDAEISMDQEILLTYVRSGLFEPDVLEVLEYILSVAPVFRNDLSIMEMRNQEYEIGKSGAFNYGKTTITADKIAQARGTIIKLMKRHAELYMTAPHPLDGTANSAAMNIIMTFYKSYPTLFMSQFIMRRGSTTPALKFAFELMVYSMLDVMYNIFLALKSGYYRWEKIKRALAAQDINWTEVTKLILRFPVFSGNLVGLAGTLLGNLALDSRSKQTLFNSVAENAMGQTVTSLYKALESYVLFAMGEVGPSSPMWNTYRALSPALGGVGGSVVKILLMQAFGDLNTSGRSSGNRSASSFVMDKIDSISHQNVRNQAVRAIFREAEYLPMERPEFRNVFGTKRWEKMAQALRNPPQEAVKPIEQQVENYEANTEWIDNYFPMPNVTKPRERSLEEQATNPIKPPDDLVD